MAKTQKNKATMGHLGMLKVRCRGRAHSTCSSLFLYASPPASFESLLGLQATRAYPVLKRARLQRLKSDGIWTEPNERQKLFPASPAPSFIVPLPACVSLQT